MLQNLKTSKIIGDVPEEKQMKIISSSKDTCKVRDISKSYTSFIEENLMNASKDQLKEKNTSTKPSCSRIIEESPQPDKEKDEAVAKRVKDVEKLFITKGTISKEKIQSTKSPHLRMVEKSPQVDQQEVAVVKEEAAAKQIFRRRSQRTSSRRSTIDFEVAQKFRKQRQPSTNIAKTKKATTSQVPEEFSLTDNRPLDSNVSFVHDEEEGLVCTSQTTGTVFKLEDCEITTNGSVVASYSPTREPEKEEQIIRELDSGISDSEDLNTEEQIPPPQPPQSRKASTSSKNRSFTKLKGKKQEACVNCSTVSNQSLNRSSTFKRASFAFIFSLNLTINNSYFYLFSKNL